jgi:membrane fusion protein (multidrug efflux system)
MKQAAPSETPEAAASPMITPRHSSPASPARASSGSTLVACVACALVLSACGKEAPKVPEKVPVNVTVYTVERRDTPVAAVYIAQTQSSQAVNIQARVSGFLDKRVYTEGAMVKAGQILFQMDQKPFQAQLDAQQAAMQRNQAALEVAKANLARTKPLAEQNALSQKDLDDAKGQYEQSAAAVEQSKAQVQEAQLNLSYTTIRSPVDGVSSFAAVADGTYLSPQNSQLTTVSVLTPMWINFSVSENQMERIRDEIKRGTFKLPEGGKFVVQIELVDGTIFPHTGRITFADPSYNSQTGTFLIRATVANPDGVLRPNQYVRTRLIGAVRPNAIVVPQRAVQQSAKGHFVWVINKQDAAELRPVTVGEWFDGDGWFITEGLEAGEKIVVDGGIRLAQGSAVKATPYVPPAAQSPKAPAGPQAAVKGGKPAAQPAPDRASVYFTRGAATLSAEATNTVRMAAAAIMGIGTGVAITGYADKTGAAGTNVELAKQRALAVRDALVQFGIQPERIRLQPPAEVTPRGGDEQARRVDIVVVQ